MICKPRIQVNRVTHELVQAAPLNLSSHTIDDTPSCILNILTNEMQWISSLKRKCKPRINHYIIFGLTAVFAS